VSRSPVVLVLGCVLLGLGVEGCSFLDSAFGVNPDGTLRPEGGFLGTAASLVNLWIPGITALVGGVGTTYAALRAKNWRKAFTSTAEVIEGAAQAGKSIMEVKAELQVAHSAAGVSGIVEKALDKFVREDEVKG
jgi:hypothetical protein